MILLLLALAFEAHAQGCKVLGPFLGAVEPREAVLFALVVEGKLEEPLTLEDAGGQKLRELPTQAEPGNGGCVQWTIGGLEPGGEYAVTLLGQRRLFRTPGMRNQPARAVLAFGSGAEDEPGPSSSGNPVWTAIQKEAPDALVLVGDAPSTDLADPVAQVRRYREFLAAPEFASLLSSTALYGIWDDRDSPARSVDELSTEREAGRRAFLDFHPNPSAGEEGQGLYARFRRGPVDVFLLDTRWFAGTEKSFADAGEPTLLGARQWEWLKRELWFSKAPFKLLVSGFAWDGAKRPGETDDWATHPHERAAVLEYLAARHISGVVLVAGGLQRSRALVHPPAETGLAYPLHELITSPLGANVSREAPLPHTDRAFDRGEPHAYLVVTADSRAEPVVLSASFRSAGAGELFRVEIAAKDLNAYGGGVPPGRADPDAKERPKKAAAPANMQDADIVFLGDSNTLGWSGPGAAVWTQRYARRKAVNLGINGAGTGTVLSRIDQGQLDGLSPKLVVLMIGTNDTNGEASRGRAASAQQIGDSIVAVVERIRKKLPQTKILLLAIFPRGEDPNPRREKVAEASRIASAVADGKTVRYLDLGDRFVGKDGRISKEIMPDFLHLSARGYEIWGQAMEPTLKEMLGER